ncbi:MAG: 30S ribosomal protein S17 [Actinobacteria bacterium]|nr:30S ribosomal protein S17 [Actinomycetota bacterium]
MERSKRKVRVGTVISDKMNKTATIAVDSYYKHPLYKKILKKIKKLKVDDPDNELNIGDVVRIAETRPLSKTKRWRLLEVVKKAQ